jgi:hypothetical protein
MKPSSSFAAEYEPARTHSAVAASDMPMLLGWS